MSWDPARKRAIIDVNMAAGELLADVRDGKRVASEEVIRLAERICANGLGSERSRKLCEAYDDAENAYRAGEITEGQFEDARLAVLAEIEDMHREIEEAAAELADVLAKEQSGR
jgi:hypothetical protein